ncbi:MAG: ribosome-associated translation inhibitor RaiA [Desulfovibrionaceae bacterium]|nr:ribosome-associated translation inhibitor RaiA [Desulfovibrionaceae bacterium]
MNINITFKNIEPSDHLKQYADTRFGKLAKYVNDSKEPELQVNLLVEKFRHKADVVLVADNVHLSAYEESEDMYSTIDLVLDKVESQLRRMRDKMKSRRKGGKERAARMDVINFAESGGQTIVKSDTFEPKPMSVDESAMQLNSRNCDFLVFRNAETGDINVIYRRKNGDFGLIDPGF